MTTNGEAKAFDKKANYKCGRLLMKYNVWDNLYHGALKTSFLREENSQDIVRQDERSEGCYAVKVDQKSLWTYLF